MPVAFADDTWTVEFGPTDEDRYYVSMCDHYFTNGDPTYVLGGVPLKASRDRVVFIDKNVFDLYWSPTIEPYFRRVGITPRLNVVTVTEATKTMQTLLPLAAWLLDQGLDRRNQPLIAIGGGVLTDVVGLLAMLYMRGVGWVRMVTTTQMWDAGNSSKVAVNLDGQKSKLGGFYPPRWSIMDRSFLATVPAPNLVDGYAEIIKDGVVCDATLFDLCDQHGASVIADRFQGPADSSPAAEMIRRAATVNLSENADNITERDLRRPMHFGHTWGPKLEGHSYALGNPLLHGASVALDMALSVELARSRGLCAADADAVLGALRHVGLPTYHPMMEDRALMEAAHANAIRSRAGNLLAPLPATLGDCQFVNDIDVDSVLAAAARLAA